MVSQVIEPSKYEMHNLNENRNDNGDNGLSANQRVPLAAPQQDKVTAAQIPPAAQLAATGQSGSSGLLGTIFFQRTLLMSLVRLTIYIHKLFQDGYSVQEYYDSNDIKFCYISIVGLVAPPVIYAIYLIGYNISKDDHLNKSEISTKTINGLLLFPWQIKRHLDVLHFSAQRVCQWRSPTPVENEDIKTMERNAEVLEFFEDFYAGFLQILMQLYIIMGTLNHFQTNTFLSGQLIGSALSVFSMMVAFRRRDDGPLTGFLSFFGWTSIIVSRVIVFSLAASVLHSWLVLLCTIHVAVVSTWVYSIAVESHHIHSSTSSINQLAIKRKRISTAIQVVLFFGIPSLVYWPIMFQLKQYRRPIIYLLVITVENIFLLGIWFAIPAASRGVQLTDTHIMLVIAVVFATLAGVIFLTGYVLCKPKLTDQVVLYEIRESRNDSAPTVVRGGSASRTANSTNYGIYYEFCDIVFKLPSTDHICEGLEEIRRIDASL